MGRPGSPSPGRFLRIHSSANRILTGSRTRLGGHTARVTGAQGLAFGEHHSILGHGRVGEVVLLQEV
jgi:hypothetical protein